MTASCTTTNPRREAIRVPKGARVRHTTDSPEVEGAVGEYRRGYIVQVRWDDQQVCLYDSRELERVDA